MRPSFVPPPPIRELRDFTRHRRVLSEERTRMVQRLEKVLQDAGIKLTSVASTVLSKSARAMLEAMLAGESDPAVLAELAKGRMRSKIPALTDALRGSFRVCHHGVLVRQILAHVDFLDGQLADLDEQITIRVATFEPIIERLQTIPGVARKCAIGMISEIGVDMRVFPTPAHLASWAGICPGNNASGGKARSGRTRHGPVALKTVLTEAAQAAARTKNTYLGARYHAIRGRRGTFKAVGAIRHDILIAYWHVGPHTGMGTSSLRGTPDGTAITLAIAATPKKISGGLLYKLIRFSHRHRTASRRSVQVPRRRQEALRRAADTGSGCRPRRRRQHAPNVQTGVAAPT